MKSLLPTFTGNRKAWPHLTLNGRWFRWSGLGIIWIRGYIRASGTQCKWFHSIQRMAQMAWEFKRMVRTGRRWWATVVELFNNCWNKSRQCWMQRRHLWPPSTQLSAPATRCHGTVLAPKLSGTGECPWGRRDRSFPPQQDRDATYHQPGPQETTPLIGPGSQISGAPPAGSCFAPVLVQIVASLASKSRRDGGEQPWRRRSSWSQPPSKPGFAPGNCCHGQDPPIHLLPTWWRLEPISTDHCLSVSINQNQYRPCVGHPDLADKTEDWVKVVVVSGQQCATMVTCAVTRSVGPDWPRLG